MTTVQTLLRHVRGGAGEPLGDLGDGQLLERFLDRRDEAAFEVLVRRHGPMVFGVCRRVLRHDQDVEDAFQATFVVLVRKGHVVVPRENVANWLYGVAYRTALRARAVLAKRRVREREVSEMPETEAAGRDLWADLEPLLDRELSRLPDAFRVAIVLCDLEGKTRKEAARQLGWAEGTVASRLARGRALLAARLGQRGVAVTGGLLTAALAERAAAGGLPPALVGATVRSGLASTGCAAAGALPANVAALSRGVLRTMLLTKLKVATAVLVAGALLVGMGGLGIGWFRDADAAAAQPPQKKDAAPAAGKVAAKTDHDLLQGRWLFVSLTVGGKNEWNKDAPAKSLTFDDDTVVFRGLNGDGTVAISQSQFKLRPSRTPKEIDLTHLDGQHNGETTRGLYELDGDVFKFGHAAQPGGDRPSTLESKVGSTDLVWTLKRALKGDQPAKKEPPAVALPLFIRGIAKEVNADARTLILEHDGGATKFTVASGANIDIDHKPGHLTWLPKGANVIVSRFTDANTIGNIEANGRNFYGAPVKTVDAAKNTITITDRDEEKTFPLAESAFITVDGKSVKLNAVPVARANIELAADQQRVLSIGADGPCLGGCDGSIVTAVNTALNTITFDEKGPSEVAGKTFTVVKDALITIDGKPGTMAALPVGSFVTLTLRADGVSVGQVRAQGPSNVCDCGGSEVAAVDAEKRTITFGEKARAEVAGKTFTLAKDAIVTIDGRPGTLTALPVGCYVQMSLWTDRQTVGMVFAQGPGNVCDCGGSEVTAIDIEKSTITFSEKARAEVAGKAFAVAKGCNIAIDGKPGRLTDLPTGSLVQMTLCVDRQTVGTIFAQGPEVPGVGLVKAVDVEKDQITIDDKTYPVAKNANILVDGKTVKLTGVPSGIYVTLRLCVDQKTLGTIFHSKAP